MKCFVPDRIISGGQTGVDRAGLDAALACAIAIGGYIPRGGHSEDGKVPAKYRLTETDSSGYARRTELNVLAADATLILYYKTISGGTLLTEQLCRRNSKPFLSVNLAGINDGAVRSVRDFLSGVCPRVLNIAGPRESKNPGIYNAAYRVLLESFAGKVSLGPD